jgi:hypothetical protein
LVGVPGPNSPPRCSGVRGEGGRGEGGGGRGREGGVEKGCPLMTNFHLGKPSVEPIKGFYLGSPNPIH